MPRVPELPLKVLLVIIETVALQDTAAKLKMPPPELPLKVLLVMVSVPMSL